MICVLGFRQPAFAPSFKSEFSPFHLPDGFLAEARLHAKWRCQKSQIKRRKNWTAAEDFANPTKSHLSKSKTSTGVIAVQNEVPRQTPEAATCTTFSSLSKALPKGPER